MNKDKISQISALLMLLSGVGLSVAGFVADPMGELSESVLWYVGQTLMYAGSIFGVTIYALARFSPNSARRGGQTPADPWHSEALPNRPHA